MLRPEGEPVIEARGDHLVLGQQPPLGVARGQPAQDRLGLGQHQRVVLKDRQGANGFSRM